MSKFDSISSYLLILLLYAVSLGVQAQSLAFPFKAEDLPAGVRLATGDHGGGIRTHAKDIVARRYVGNNKWYWNTAEGMKVPQGTPLENKHRVIYGMPFYAMADGEVIGCWRNAPDNPGPNQTHPDRAAGRIIGGGNHLWIRHDDGKVALYAHAIPGTIPASICPNNDTLFPEPPATCSGALRGNPDVHPCAFVPAGVPPTTPTGPNTSRPRVVKGQFLGNVGNSGQSSQPHLHFHLESGFGGTSRALPMVFEKGLWTPLSGGSSNTADINDWRSFSGNALPDRSVLVWPPRSLTPEYTRHGFQANALQRMIDHLGNSGFMPKLIDCYGIGGQLFFNMVWRPAQGNWRVYAGVNESKYQQAFNDASNDNYTPVFVDSCSSSGSTRYVAIFQHDKGSALARHKLSKKQHSDLQQEMTGIDWAPVSVSVVSKNGKREYTVLYSPNAYGQWQSKSHLRRDASGDRYQEAVEDAKAFGLKPIYVNAYMHDGAQHFSAIFAENPVGSWKARHDKTGKEFQTIFEESIDSGYYTNSVTAFDGSNRRHVFAGIWIKPFVATPFPVSGILKASR